MLGKSNRELKDESIETRLKELDEKIDNEIKKVKDALFKKQEAYHHQSEEIRDDFIKRQNESKSHREKLQAGQDLLTENVNNMMNMLQEYIKKDNEKTVATLRTSLWRMHKDFVDQGFVTPDGLKTFTEEGKVYEAAGGNDIYHEKLLPEVLNLEIRYPNGSIYNHNRDE